MKKQVLFLNFLLFLLLIIAGCSDDDKPEIVQTLTVTKPALTFEAKGGKQSFSIKSNAKWEILTENKSWCKISPLKGEGDADIEVEVDESSTESILSTQLTVKISSKSAIVRIKQDAAVLPPPEGLHYPLLTINTEGGKNIESKDVYLNATIKIEARDDKGEVTETLLEAETEIKGRGNSTWGMEKKPYRLKLTKSVEVLGMPKSKHWVLLANYSDKTLMRNELAFEISRRMGFAYTTRAKYVDVVLNGDYIGSYMLCEHLRVDKNRVNIPELAPGDTDISGGYLLEIDERQGEPKWFKTELAGMTFCINTPEDIPVNQEQYISSHVQEVENVIYGKGGIDTETELPKYLDMKSFIDYLLLNEISKNVDGNLRLSTYVYKNRGDDKLYFGPVWDYDISFGNVNYDGCERTDGWHARSANWYQQIFKHPKFEKMLADRWKELRSDKLGDLNTFIDGLAANMETSQWHNFRRWKILDKAVWPNPVVPGSYEGEVAYLKDWLGKRINWIDQTLK